MPTVQDGVGQRVTDNPRVADLDLRAVAVRAVTWILPVTTTGRTSSSLHVDTRPRRAVTETWPWNARPENEHAAGKRRRNHQESSMEAKMNTDSHPASAVGQRA